MFLNLNNETSEITVMSMSVNRFSCQSNVLWEMDGHI